MDLGQGCFLSNTVLVHFVANFIDLVDSIIYHLSSFRVLEYHEPTLAPRLILVSFLEAVQCRTVVKEQDRGGAGVYEGPIADTDSASLSRK